MTAAATTLRPSRHHSLIDLMRRIFFFESTATIFKSSKNAEYADDHRLARPSFLALAF
jgi:hypothetical protein